MAGYRKQACKGDKEEASQEVGEKSSRLLGPRSQNEEMCKGVCCLEFRSC